MTYLRRTNLGPKKSRAAAVLMLSGIAVLVAIDFIFPSFYPRLLNPLASSAWKSEDASVGAFGRALALVSSKLSLVSENLALKDELRSRDADALALQALREENAALKASVGRAEKGNEVLAVVLSRPPVSAYDTLVLDVGSSDGVAVGQRVYVDGTVLIGDVSEVTAGSAKASLFSTPGRETPVHIGARSTETQAVGRGGGNFYARLPADVSLAVGDIVTSPQMRSNVFGVVEKIEVGATDSIQTVYFRAPFNMHELRYVEIDLGR